MDNTSSCLDHGDNGIFNHRLNQPSTTTWNKQIQIALSLHHSKARSPTRILDQLENIRMESCFFQSSLEGCHDRLSRMKGILSSTKDHCISTLDSKRCSIRRHIWTAFINDANNTHGDSNFLDFKAIFQDFSIQHFPDRIWQVY